MNRSRDPKPTSELRCDTARRWRVQTSCLFAVMEALQRSCFFFFVFFFFQAEDGIRDYKVTGVQTCALPIYHQRLAESEYQQDVYADYTLRAATKLLGSDFVYTSHLVGLHYRVAHGKHQLMEQAVAGSVIG